MTSVQPLEIRRIEGRGVVVRWSDNTTCELPSELLRRNCPCATCRESRGDLAHSAPLTPPAPKKKSALAIVENSLEDEVKLTEVWVVGNYAVGMRWGDGHSTGIYTYDYLRELSR